MRATLILAPILFAVPAAAQQPTIMQPTRDVVVAYHISGAAAAQHRATDVKMYFTNRGNKLRIEPVGQPGYSIVDRAAAHMTIVMVPQRMYMDMPYDPKKVMAFDDKDAQYTKRGSDTVAGIACTVYDVTAQGRSGEVCLSDDGLMLRAKSETTGQPNGDMVATSVTYGAQSADLFAPPADFKKMDMAGIMGNPPPQH